MNRGCIWPTPGGLFTKTSFSLATDWAAALASHHSHWWCLDVVWLSLQRNSFILNICWMLAKWYQLTIHISMNLNFEILEEHYTLHSMFHPISVSATVSHQTSPSGVEFTRLYWLGNEKKPLQLLKQIQFFKTFYSGSVS